jgi:hypothetical protein
MKKFGLMIGCAAVLGALVAIARAGDPETRVPWDDTSDAVVSLTVTNGMVVGLIAPKMILNPTGMTNGGLNALTFKTPFPFKGETVIMIDPTSTNRIGLAASATFLRSADLVMITNTATKAVVIKPVSTTVCAALN